MTVYYRISLVDSADSPIPYPSAPTARSRWNDCDCRWIASRSSRCRCCPLSSFCPASTAPTSDCAAPTRTPTNRTSDRVSAPCRYARCLRCYHLPVSTDTHMRYVPRREGDVFAHNFCTLSRWGNTKGDPPPPVPDT